MTAPAPPLAYLAALDGVRALAIVMVLVWHYFTGIVHPELLGGLTGLLQKLTGQAWAGVDVFFVLSGFLIGRILICNQGSARYFSTFYIRRAFRIFPPYLLVIFAFVLISPLLNAPWASWLVGDAQPLWSYLLYLQNWFMNDGFGANWLGVTWSLAVEEQFYLLFPVLIYLCPNRWIPALCLALVVVAVSCRALLYEPGSYAAYVLLPARVDALALGALIAWSSLDNSGNSSMLRLSRINTILWALIGTILFLIAKVILKEGLGGPVLHLGLALVSSSLVLFAVREQGGLIMRVLGGRLCRWLASISYMLYLLHQPILGLVHGVMLQQEPAINNLADALVTLLALTLALLLSTLSLRFFEKPLLQLGRRFTY